MKSINNLENKASSKKRTSFIKIFTFICFSFLSLTLIFSGFNLNSKDIEFSKASSPLAVTPVYETISYKNYSTGETLFAFSGSGSSKYTPIEACAPLSVFSNNSIFDESYKWVLNYVDCSIKGSDNSYTNLYLFLTDVNGLPPMVSGFIYTMYFDYLTNDFIFSIYKEMNSNNCTYTIQSFTFCFMLYPLEAFSSGYTEEDINNSYNSGYTAGQNSVDITTDNNQAIQDYITDNNYHTDTEYNQYGESQYQAGQESVDITTDNQQVIDDFILSTAFECNESYEKFQLSNQVSSYSVALPENLFELVSVDFTLISYYSSGSFLYNDTFDFSVNSFPYVVIGSQNAEYCRISLSDNVLLFEFITPSNTNGFYCYIDSLNVVYTCLGYTQEQYDLNYNNGYDLGSSEGYSAGYDVGYNEGYSVSYEKGKTDALNGNQTFKGLIYSIIDAPFNVISSAFDFDIFGVNIASFLMLIVSLLLVAFVLRRLL